MWAAVYEDDATDSFCGAVVERGGRRVEVEGTESGVPPRFEELLDAVSQLAVRSVEVA